MKNVCDYDTNFDESVFLSRVDRIFIMILDSIMDRDMSSVKHYLSNDLYKKYDKLVTSYINDHKIRLFDEMNVKSTSIDGFNINDNKINIEVTLTSRYMDYFVNEDGKYLNGINDHRIEKLHHLVLTKRLDAKPLEEARRCPSCGNTLDINNTGICPYCNHTFNMEDYDYILTSMESGYDN